jgi:SnoaL-like protein
VTSHPVSRYVPLLIAGDVEGLLDLFGNAPRVNDPRLGWIEEERFEGFVTASHEGLAERKAEVEHLATTSTADGAVDECILSLVRRGATVRLPVAVAAVVSGSVLASVHIYHSMWPLMGAHAIRRPILPALAGLRLPDVIGRYHDSLTEGDVSAVVRHFEADGLLREPLGEGYVHRGAAELREFFRQWLANGGLSVERCSLTDDGACCALEYNVTAWGATPVPRQAGIAVYRRGRSGFLAAARIYDDVEAPAGRPDFAAERR